jgi:hypothetical protein
MQQPVRLAAQRGVRLAAQGGVRLAAQGGVRLAAHLGLSVSRRRNGEKEGRPTDKIPASGKLVCFFLFGLAAQTRLGATPRATPLAAMNPSQLSV